MAEPLALQVANYDQRETVHNSSTSNVLFVRADQNRYALIISNNGAQDIYISTNPNAAAGAGLKIPTGSLPFIITFPTAPGLVGSAWYLNGLVGGSQVTDLQVFYRPQQDPPLPDFGKTIL